MPVGEVEDVGEGLRIIVAPAGQTEQSILVAKPAGVMDALADGERRERVGQLGHVLANCVVERELTFVGEQADRERGELLRHRRDVKDRVRRDLDPVVEVRHAVAALMDHLTAQQHGDRCAGAIGAVPLRKQLVNPRAELALHHITHIPIHSVPSEKLPTNDAE